MDLLTVKTNKVSNQINTPRSRVAPTMARRTVEETGIQVIKEEPNLSDIVAGQPTPYHPCMVYLPTFG